MDVIMVKTRYVYPSYTDLVTLMDLSEFETCYVEQIDFQREALYILGTLNGEYRPHRELHKNGITAFCVFWSLERPGPERMVGYCVGMRKLLNEWKFDEIWCPDPYVVELIDDSRVRYVPIGGHPDLGSSVRKKVKYDITHLSYASPRRKSVYHKIKEMGWEIGPNCWGQGRTDVLEQTRIMLNVHQDDWPMLEPLRFVLAACSKIPIISEHIEHAGIYKRHGPNHYYIDVEYADLVSTLDEARDEELHAMAQRTYDMVTTEFEFSRVVKTAVSDVMKGREINPGVIR